jgi:hypothetical protein
MTRSELEDVVARMNDRTRHEVTFKLSELEALQQHFVKLGFVYVDDDLEAATVLRRLADGLDERGAIGQHFRYDDLYIGRVVMASGYA